MGKLISIWLLEVVVNIYDIITLPIYYLIQQPWKVEQAANRVRARKVGEATWVNVESKLDKSNRKSIDTLDQLFRDSVLTYSSKKCLGTRKIIAIEYKDSNQANGFSPSSKNIANESISESKPKKVISKYVLDNEYTWLTYKEIDEVVRKLSAGLVNICNNSLENSDGSRKVLICADTCMQWFLMAHACFRNNVTVVTAYTTLEDDAILHSIQQTEVKILVVSQKFAPRLKRIIPQAPIVDTIIILDEPLPGEVDVCINVKSLLDNTNIKRICSYDDLIVRGSETKESISSVPVAKDIAVLMYTSGSTGKAKGVMLSHESIVYTALSFSGPGDISHEDRYIGYLPLGHVLELAAECIFLRNGSTIAYSSPATLTSSSPMVKKGQLGDANIFKPTIMGAVPLVLDRIKSGVQQAVKSKGRFYDQLYNDFVYKYKSYWWHRYYDTPILNRFVCKPLNMILGGEIRAVCSGGAALSCETQEYLRYVTNLTVLQGYGMTETSAAASFCDIYDRRCNVVGAPYPIVHLKLESWSDYSIHDKPNPRGEIVIGGQPVSAGYYKMDDLTNESFYVDQETGMRFFKTGDIGLMLPDGVLKIIDRKKDIVKPLSGEYISLNEIESALKINSIVESICAYCSLYSNYVVAIVKPDSKELLSHAKRLIHGNNDLAEKFRRTILENFAQDSRLQDSGDIYKTKDEIDKILDGLSTKILYSNKWLVEYVLKSIQAEGMKQGLKKTHIPSRIKLAHEDWSPENGLVTASFKLRRREIERHYAEDIKQLYADLGQKIDH